MQDGGGDGGGGGGGDDSLGHSPVTGEASSTSDSIPTSSADSSPSTPDAPASVENIPADVAPVVVAQNEPAATKRDPRTLLTKALDALQVGKKKKLDKVMALAQQKRTITNNDVQLALRCSDATATRYLNQLVKEGKLKMVGNDGSSRYELNR